MEAKFHFTHLKEKKFNFLLSKNITEYLTKWSIKGQIKICSFCFNEAFQLYQKQEFIENFFKDSTVKFVLDQILPTWFYDKEKIKNIHAEMVPCTVSSMSFFDRIIGDENKIVRSGGDIRHCLDNFVNGFMISDELRKMLIDEESNNHELFTEKDRKEFIFRIFQFLVLGGKWCQFEDNINPYLELTKLLYKDLVKVEKNPETKRIEIRSICLKVVITGRNETPILPLDPQHIQNFMYLIIDPLMRQITIFAHEYGGQF